MIEEAQLFIADQQVGLNDSIHESFIAAAIHCAAPYTLDLFNHNVDMIAFMDLCNTFLNR